MSRDVKYIGMDVHKEAIVIAIVQFQVNEKGAVNVWLATQAGRDFGQLRLNQGKGQDARECIDPRRRLSYRIY